MVPSSVTTPCRLYSGVRCSVRNTGRDVIQNGLTTQQCFPEALLVVHRRCVRVTYVGMKFPPDVSLFLLLKMAI